MGPAQRDIQAFLGIMPRYARPPYLTKGAVINQAMAAEGLCDVLISVDSRDSAAPVVSKDIVCANFEQIKGNDIVLIHDNKLQTYLAVRDCLFPILNSKGLIAVSLHELFTGVLDNDTIVPAGGHVEIKAGAPGQTVIGQLTVDGARGNGYLTAYPCSEGQPLASDLNYVRNEANANLLYVKLDEQGKFCVSTNGSATNIIYDQTAEVSSLELPVHKSERKYDSREGAGKLAAGHILRLKLAGPNQIVIGQITNDRAEQAGFVTAFNCDNSQPPTSNLNYVIGRPSSNRYHAQTNANGEVCFYSSGTTDLIIDQSAELEPSAMSFDTTRLVDTRASGNTLPDNGSISVAAGLPNQTIIGQLTVDREKGSGFATIYPCDKSLPTASNVNYAADRPRSSSIIASTDAIGKDCIYVNKATDVIFDKVATAQWASHAPVRMLDTRTIPQ